MSNFKENPRNAIITFKATEEEKRKLQKLASRRTNGKLSELVWNICLEYMRKEEDNSNGTE